MAIKADIRLALGKRPDVRIWNSPNGEAWAGEVVSRSGDRVVLKRAYRIVYGLCPGASDLTGITRRVITPEMIGNHIGFFTVMEVKRPGVTVPDHQQNFLNVIGSLGGIAGVVRSAEDALNLIGGVV